MGSGTDFRVFPGQKNGFPAVFPWGVGGGEEKGRQKMAPRSCTKSENRPLIFFAMTSTGKKDVLDATEDELTALVGKFKGLNEANFTADI